MFDGSVTRYLFIAAAAVIAAGGLWLIWYWFRSWAGLIDDEKDNTE